MKAGDEWRQTLYRELDEARAMVCLCSPQYDSSPWCVGEVAIAVKDGKTVIPIRLAKTAAELRSEPLPLLLQTHQIRKMMGMIFMMFQLGHPDHRGKRDLADSMVQRDPWVLKALEVHKVSQAIKVRLDQKVLWDLKDLKVHRVSLELMVLLQLSSLLLF